MKPLAALLLLAGSLSLAPAFGQVKIPAQSASSQKSGEVSGGTSASPLRPKSQVKSTVTKTRPEGPTNFVPQNKPGVKPGMPVTAVQRVPAPTQNLDPARMARLAELRRELKIAEAANETRLNLRANDLFLDDAPTTIDKLIEPTLAKVAEYIRLNDKQNVTVKPYYVDVKDGGAEGDKQLAWTRSLVLIEWMTKNGKLGVEHFRASGPAPVAKATAKEFTSVSGDTEFVARIDLHLEY